MAETFSINFFPCYSKTDLYCTYCIIIVIILYNYVHGYLVHNYYINNNMYFDTLSNSAQYIV